MSPFNSVFELPEYVIAYAKFTDTAIKQLAYSRNPLLRQIPVSPVSEVPTMHYSLPSGETLEHEPIIASAEVEILTDDLVKGNLDTYYCFIDQLADELLNSLMPQISSRMSGVLDAYGQSVYGEGKPFNLEAIIKMLSIMDMEFDAEGNISDSHIIYLDKSERLFKVSEALTIFPPENPAQEKAWNELIDKKRQEFYARKRTRKLS